MLTGLLPTWLAQLAFLYLPVTSAKSGTARNSPDPSTLIINKENASVDYMPIGQFLSCGSLKKLTSIDG